MAVTINFLNDTALKALYEENKTDIVIIDVREPLEYDREHIPGSRNIPLDELGKQDFLSERHKLAIFHCKSGGRTRFAQSLLMATGFNNIYCLENGIEQWKRCKLPIIKNSNAPMEIMRQVQITAGLIIILSIICYYMLSPYWLLLNLIAGIGLLLSGITGTCLMARLLLCMPWNRR